MKGSDLIAAHTLFQALYNIHFFHTGITNTSYLQGLTAAHAMLGSSGTVGGAGVLAHGLVENMGDDSRHGFSYFAGSCTRSNDPRTLPKPGEA